MKQNKLGEQTALIQSVITDNLLDVAIRFDKAKRQKKASRVLKAKLDYLVRLKNVLKELGAA